LQNLKEIINLKEEYPDNITLLLGNHDVDYDTRNNEIEEPFIAHGFYTVSNAGGYEVQLSDDGDLARIRDAYGSDNPKVSEWFEIEWVPDEDADEEEDADLIAVIDPDGYNIPLNQVMRTNYRK